MGNKKDPVEEGTSTSKDLYGIATWEERTILDRIAAGLFRSIVAVTRVGVVAIAILILLAIGGMSALGDPQIRILTALSAIPALGLAGYIWWQDETQNEPLSLLVATFLLGVLTASFAAVVNSVLNPYFQGFAAFGTILFYFIVVGPIEETVKLLAVRLYAYTKDSFNAVIDGAVYGAMAGLGFAFIENALYIMRQVGTESAEMGVGLIGAGAGITAARSLAGPGHVIYSAFAGYYLGLAKFNPENRGPIVIKGIIIAAGIHALYNSTVSIGPALIASVSPLDGFLSFVAYVVIYDGFFGFLLFRKIRKYGRAYRAMKSEEKSVEEARPEGPELE